MVTSTQLLVVSAKATLATNRAEKPSDAVFLSIINIPFLMFCLILSSSQKPFNKTPLTNLNGHGEPFNPVALATQRARECFARDSL
nr:MAG TPA: hypothetical protein [Caudoviricetes sp.]